ncbi:MAG: (4Fe-4S)-binding protein [Flavobacteriaceae bacterium]|nr:(4Fe-4S)-binding protein [Flavobacteriaceae bacterium]
METLANVFSNDDITVTFEPYVCIHAENCAKELSEVFRTSVIPWINLDATKTKRIIKQINRCPSGALKYELNTNKKVSA